MILQFAWLSYLIASKMKKNIYSEHEEYPAMLLKGAIAA